LNHEALLKHLTSGYHDIKITKKENIEVIPDEIDEEILMKIEGLDGDVSREEDINHFKYYGELTWHQLVDKMIRNGFEQDFNYNKLCGSNSYKPQEQDLKGLL